MAFLEDRLAVKGKIAAVMGGAGGLGLACSRDFARAGMRLAIADNDPEALAALPGQLGDGAIVFSSEIDVRNREAQARFFARIDETYGGLDVLVNVAGGSFRQPFMESNPRSWEAIMEANFTWLLASIQHAVTRMRPRGGGSIMSITSIEGHRAAPNYAVYSAMKAAVTNLTRTLALELAPDSIRINTLAPDFIPTPRINAIMFEHGVDAATIDMGDQISIPIGRRGNYEDFGGCALFLASDLSRYVTGTTLHPDGGATPSQGWFNWPGSGWLNRPPADISAGFLASDE